jgi:putative lipoic acid-binding regulatory protein
MTSDTDERSNTLALLESHHTFPGEYAFRIVTHAGRGSEAVAAVAALAQRVLHVRERESSGGRYVSLAVRVEIESAERVLDTYEVLSDLDAVLTTL